MKEEYKGYPSGSGIQKKTMPYAHKPAAQPFKAHKKTNTNPPQALAVQERPAAAKRHRFFDLKHSLHLHAWKPLILAHSPFFECDESANISEKLADPVRSMGVRRQSISRSLRVRLHRCSLARQWLPGLMPELPFIPKNFYLPTALLCFIGGLAPVHSNSRLSECPRGTAHVDTLPTLSRANSLFTVSTHFSRYSPSRPPTRDDMHQFLYRTHRQALRFLLIRKNPKPMPNPSLRNPPMNGWASQVRKRNHKPKD